ncbi:MULTISPECIES: winged helix-turn-helix domain-containing protein [Halorussus]|uniref:winged helix-turn-helix domain-containing protein n=1 Tax=Halorussus TaxID=1070314 RepID=UPI000E20E2D4|nr:MULTISPECIES: winged helix-turn-helix domain-containing protein [Halorussus]NHN58759.1 winged helix-turn-helix domain-containing protein [Halorussus sp. JP-T4]
MSQKTDLQREILLTAHQNPDLTNKEIADRCDCSSSYVSTVLNRYEDYGVLEAMDDQMIQDQRELDRMLDGMGLGAGANDQQSGSKRGGGNTTPAVEDFSLKEPETTVDWIVQIGSALFALLIVGYVLIEVIQTLYL